MRAAVDVYYVSNMIYHVQKRASIASMECKATSKGGERPEYATLRKDPAMDKYFKMLSFGVPRTGVTQKMAQDEMPPEKVAIFAAGPDGSDVSYVARAERYLSLISDGTFSQSDFLCVVLKEK